MPQNKFLYMKKIIRTHIDAILFSNKIRNFAVSFKRE